MASVGQQVDFNSATDSGSDNIDDGIRQTVQANPSVRAASTGGQTRATFTDKRCLLLVPSGESTCGGCLETSCSSCRSLMHEAPTARYVDVNVACHSKGNTLPLHASRRRKQRQSVGPRLDERPFTRPLTMSEYYCSPIPHAHFQRLAE